MPGESIFIKPAKQNRFISRGSPVAALGVAVGTEPRDAGWRFEWRTVGGTNLLALSREKRPVPITNYVQ